MDPIPPFQYVLESITSRHLDVSTERILLSFRSCLSLNNVIIRWTSVHLSITKSAQTQWFDELFLTIITNWMSSFIYILVASVHHDVIANLTNNSHLLLNKCVEMWQILQINLYINKFIALDWCCQSWNFRIIM